MLEGLFIVSSTLSYTYNRKKSGKFVVTKAKKKKKPRPLAFDVTFAVEGLPRMDGITGKSDPFLQVYAHPRNVRIVILT